MQRVKIIISAFPTSNSKTSRVFASLTGLISCSPFLITRLSIIYSNTDLANQIPYIPRVMIDSKKPLICILKSFLGSPIKPKLKSPNLRCSAKYFKNFTRNHGLYRLIVSVERNPLIRNILPISRGLPEKLKPVFDHFKLLSL